jgi:hypothetical protein
MLTNLLLGLNFFGLIIIFFLKSQVEENFLWILSLPWLSFFNLFIDIAVDNTISSNSALCMWIFISILWLISSIISQILEKSKSSKVTKNINNKVKAIDIDDLTNSDVNEDGDNKSKLSPESAGATFTAALSQAIMNDKKDNGSVTTDDAKNVLASIPPEVTKQFKHLQMILEKIESKDNKDYFKKK